jgi:hypothetical protein
VPTYPDSVLKFAKAISVAEGSKPEWNNPGDLTSHFGFPVTGTANSEGVLIFQNAEDGQEALYRQVSLMLTGKSKVYKLTDTLEQVGLKYAGGDGNWAKNVGAYLGIPLTTTLAEIAQL